MAFFGLSTMPLQAATGLTVEDVEQRIAFMTNIEVAQLNQQIADLLAGGDVVAVLECCLLFLY